MRIDSQFAESEITEDEIDLSDLARRVSKYKYRILLIAIISVVLAGLYITTTRLMSQSDIYEYVIQTDFSGRNQGKYPNGSPFRLSDIISPAVLSGIYEKKNIARFDIKKTDFLARFSVAPYTKDRSILVKKYELLFDQKKATLAELQDMQRQQSQELEAASKVAAILRFNSAGMSIPQAVAEEILKSVPIAWTNYAINSLGVLKADISIVQPSSFDDNVIQGLDPVAAFEVIILRLDLLNSQLSAISELAGGNVVQDTETGMNTKTLRSSFHDMKVRLKAIPLSLYQSYSANSQNRPLPIKLYSSKLFEPEIMAGIDYLVALDMLSERIQLIRSNINIILEQKYGGIATDLETGLTVYDIQRLLEDINEFELRQLRSPILQLGISKDPQLIEFYYVSRITELERQKENLRGKSSNLVDSLNIYTRSGNEGSLSTASSEYPQGGGTTVIPQFGDAFIDRLIKLSEEGGDKQFQQEFSKKSVDFLQSVEDIKTDLNRFKEYLKIFTDRLKDKDKSEPEEIEKYVGILEDRIPNILSRLKDYSQVTVRISRRLRYASNMFNLMNGPDSSVKISEDYYLSTDNTAELKMEDFLPVMKKYAETLLRIYDTVSAEQNGRDQLLFTPITNAELIRIKIIQRSDVILIGFALFLGLFLGLISAFVSLGLDDKHQA